jgi:hypothetical protein
VTPEEETRLKTLGTIKGLADFALYLRHRCGIEECSEDMTAFLIYVLEETNVLAPHVAAGFSEERTRDEGLQMHSFLRWADRGLPTFDVTHGLMAALLLTDPSDVGAEDVKLPFGTFALRLPTRSGRCAGGVLRCLRKRRGRAMEALMTRRKAEGERVAGTLLWMALLTTLACGSSQPGMPPVTPDAGGSGGGGSAGSDDGGGAAGGDSSDELPCVTYKYGCQCNTGDVGNAKSCSGGSVAGSQGAIGLCCKGDGPCQCSSFACSVKAAERSCLCSGAKLAEEDHGVLGPDCGSLKGAPGITCCMESVSCVCGGNKCSFVGQEVPSCDAATMSRLWCSVERRADSCP